jgi:ketosteroid isomerase-like protein
MYPGDSNSIWHRCVALLYVPFPGQLSPATNFSLITQNKSMYKFLVVVFLVILCQCSFAQHNKQADIDKIKAARTASNAALAKHDLDGLSKDWLNDFSIVIGRGVVMNGKETIIASWKKLFETNPTVSYVRDPTEIIISDNDTLAWETGKWKAFNSYSKGGNYSAMWRRSANEWKLQAELFVSLND